MISESKRIEFRLNFEIFKKTLPTLLPDHEDEFALMRHGELVDYFATAADALRAGQQSYDDDLFSVQKVTARVADFGWYSRAPNQKQL